MTHLQLNELSPYNASNQKEISKILVRSLVEDYFVKSPGGFQLTGLTFLKVTLQLNETQVGFSSNANIHSSLPYIVEAAIR